MEKPNLQILYSGFRPAWSLWNRFVQEYLKAVPMHDEQSWVRRESATLCRAGALQYAVELAQVLGT